MSGLSGPDPKQHDAITCSTNAVVSAGAGSGKTYVLTERFYRLLAEGKAEVEQILTLTFTRKAAAEMFERIYRRLLGEQDRSEIIRRQVRKFDEAQISTLDSFCAQIARTGAGIFGITPDFSIDDPKAKELSEQTALKFLLHRADEPVLKAYIIDYGFERIWKDLFAAYGHQHVSIVSNTDFQAMGNKQQEHLLLQLDRHADAMFSAGNQILGLDSSAGKSVAANQAALSVLGDLKEAYASQNYAGIAELSIILSLSKAGIGRSKKPELVQLGEYIDAFKMHQTQVSLIAKTLENWDFTEVLFGLLAGYQKELIQEKRRQGLCSFQDVVALAIEILRQNKRIRDYYKSMFRYIMIDEFQDNNEIQKQLLYLLAEKENLFTDRPAVEDLEEGKLFFVGDDKQSIYRFRGADVSVFKTLCDELTDSNGSHIEMENNYRSNAGLIDFYNYLFRSILTGTREEENGVPYEAAFLPLKFGGDDLGVVSNVTIFYKPYDSEEDPAEFAGGDETEAYTIAQYIHDHVENKTLPIRDNGAVRPAVYNDFALLMRSTSNQAVYERIFRQFKIPYATDNIRTLFLEAPFNDFYNVMQLSLFPSDRIAYAAYLRSPLTGCSDEAVVKLLLLDDDPFTRLPEDLKMDETDTVRYSSGKDLYLFLKNKIDVWSIGKIARYIWYDSGYRYLLLTNPAYQPYLEYFDYLYYLAVDADRKSLSMSEFLDFMRQNLGKYERLDDFDMLKDSKEGVQILTIHKSKGLEFPVVILANTGNVGNKGGGSELFYASKEYGTTFSPAGLRGKSGNYFYTLMADENKKMEIAEIKRLLYVACTRAQDHLIISGYHHRNNRTAEEAMLNMVLQGLGIQSDTETVENAVFQKINPLPVRTIRSRYESVGVESVRAKIDEYMKLPVIEFSFDRREFSVTELSEYQLTLDAADGGDAAELDLQELPLLHWEGPEEGGGRAAAFGTFAHYVMEQQIKGTYGRDDIPAYLLAPFDGSLVSDIKQSAEDMAERFFSSPLIDEYNSAIRVETEYDFISRYVISKKEIFVYGRIDLLFETDKKLYVVDFKTDRTYVPWHYSRQLNMYAKAAAAFSNKPVACYLFFMRDGSLHEMNPDPAFIPSIPSVKEAAGFSGRR